MKSFIQYSFIPVVAIAFLMIFEQFVFRYVTTLPPTITSAEYGVYALQAVAVIAHVLRGHRAGPVVDELDLLGSRRPDDDLVGPSNDSRCGEKGASTCLVDSPTFLTT